MGSPTLKDMHAAIRDVWVHYRASVRRTDFLAALRGRERQTLVRSWGEMEAIWTRYRDEASHAADHFEANPHVYGASTPEMIARFRGLAKGEYGKASRKWREWREWAETARLPTSLRGYDPTTPADVVDFSPDEADLWAPVIAVSATEHDRALGLTLLHTMRRART